MLSDNFDLFLFHLIRNALSAAHKDKEPALPLSTEVCGPHSLITPGKNTVSFAPTFVTHQVSRKVKIRISFHS